MQSVDALVAELDENGILVLDLTRVLQETLDRHLRRDQRQEERSEGETESEERRRQRQQRQGVSGWGRPPDQDYNPQVIDAARVRQILRDPIQYVEFVYQNRRFKLKPVGTMDPVPKRIQSGSRGGSFYYKNRNSRGELLPMEQWTKVYLKDYQRRQCFRGKSTRTRGLAGYVDGDCVAQAPRRFKQSRAPKISRQQEEGGRRRRRAQ